MNITVMSDLHLEFRKDYYMEVPGGDVLVLAGDICVASEYDLYHDFFLQCVAKYNKVFYVIGNHENYEGDISGTIDILTWNLPAGITLLHNTSEHYRGVNFVGATLWSNFDNMNINVMEEARKYMNDYHAINKEGAPLRPEDTLLEHLGTREWFERRVPTLDGPVFMITHHAPSAQSVQGRYKAMEHCYSTDMESFIKSNPNIVGWAHGHIHHNNDYMIGNCRVVSNPGGYHKMEENSTFDAGFCVEIPMKEDA